MSEPLTTREKLLDAARALFWTRGYSNVSVRQVAAQAGVDAALVSRYFGGKHGLFTATLGDLVAWDVLPARAEDILAHAAKSFAQPHDPARDAVNPFTMLLANIIDPELGPEIRALVKQKLSDPLAQKLGGPVAEERAAMLLAVLFGVALMRKSFQLAGFVKQDAETLEAQIMQLGVAALAFAADRDG